MVVSDLRVPSERFLIQSILFVLYKMVLNFHWVSVCIECFSGGYPPNPCTSDGPNFKSIFSWSRNIPWAKLVCELNTYGPITVIYQGYWIQQKKPVKCHDHWENRIINWSMTKWPGWLKPSIFYNVTSSQIGVRKEVLGNFIWMLERCNSMF